MFRDLHNSNMISLTRPLVFFDLETTGIDLYQDRIVQIGAIQLLPNGEKKEWEWLINPTIPIPKEAYDIHGITNDMVRDKPTFGELSDTLSTLFFGADLGGYNVRNFDIPMLVNEFNRIGMALDTESIAIIDSYAIWRAKEPRTLAAAYEKYCGKTLVNAHDAIVDIRTALDVFEGQIQYYEDIPTTVHELHELTFPKDADSYDAEGKLKFVDGVLTINFGKNKGKTLQALATNDPRYLEWILGGSFSEKVKGAVRGVLT